MCFIPWCIHNHHSLTHEAAQEAEQRHCMLSDYAVSPLTLLCTTSHRSLHMSQKMAAAYLCACMLQRDPIFSQPDGFSQSHALAGSITEGLVCTASLRIRDSLPLQCLPWLTISSVRSNEEVCPLTMTSLEMTQLPPFALVHAPTHDQGWRQRHLLLHGQARPVAARGHCNQALQDHRQLRLRQLSHLAAGGHVPCIHTG